MVALQYNKTCQSCQDLSVRLARLFTRAGPTVSFASLWRQSLLLLLRVYLLSLALYTKSRVVTVIAVPLLPPSLRIPSANYLDKG
jgi:hypothetical protein